MKHFFIGLLLGCVVWQTIEPIFPLNFIRPYNINLKPPVGDAFQLTTIVERNFNSKGFNDDGCVVNALQLWQPTQKAISMLYGFAPCTPIGQYAVALNLDDDLQRGHINFKGDLEYTALSFAARYYLPCDFSLGLFLPIYFMRMGVKHQDVSPIITNDDFRYQAVLGADLCQKVACLGNLDIGPWRKNGIGDLVLLGEWVGQYRQDKPLLNNVILNARFGFTFPTGVRKDEDIAVSIPFGNDGACGLIFAGGINVALNCLLDVGVDAEFLYLFANGKERRIATAPGQTDLLFLAKTEAYKDWGFTERFNIFVQTQNFKGMQFRADYEFLKHNDDRLFLVNNCFDSRIANCAHSLEEWTLHQWIFMFKWDAAAVMDPCASPTPYVSFFYKVPFNGRNAMATDGMGVEFAITF